MNTDNLRVKWIEVEAPVWEAQQAELKALREEIERLKTDLGIERRSHAKLESQLAELRQGGEAVVWIASDDLRQLRENPGKREVIAVFARKECSVGPTSPLFTRPQPAIQPGYVVVPLIPTRAMEDVVNQDEWQWEDLLAAAEAITEDQYNEIASASAIQPQATTNTQERGNEK